MSRFGEAFGELTIDEFHGTLDAVCVEMITLLRSKRESYGPNNLTRFGEAGMIVRTGDKLERLWHMHRQGLQTTSVDEDRLDAWRDIAGYALLRLAIEKAEELERAATQAPDVVGMAVSIPPGSYRTDPGTCPYCGLGGVHVCENVDPGYPREVSWQNGTMLVGPRPGEQEEGS